MCWRENIPPRGSSRAVIEYLMGTCLQVLRDDNHIQHVTDRSAERPYYYDTHGLHSWRVFLYVGGNGHDVFDRAGTNNNTQDSQLIFQGRSAYLFTRAALIN